MIWKICIFTQQAEWQCSIYDKNSMQERVEGATLGPEQNGQYFLHIFSNVFSQKMVLVCIFIQIRHSIPSVNGDACQQPWICQIKSGNYELWKIIHVYSYLEYQKSSNWNNRPHMYTVKRCLVIISANVAAVSRKTLILSSSSAN